MTYLGTKNVLHIACVFAITDIQSGLGNTLLFVVYFVSLCGFNYVSSLVLLFKILRHGGHQVSS